MDKTLNKKTILIIAIILVVLGLIFYFLFPYILKFNQEQKFIFYWILFSIPLFFIHFYGIFKNLKKLENVLKQQKEILENIVPQKGIVEDFIIFSDVWYDSDNFPRIHYKFIPIIRNLENGKRYATYGEYSFASCKYHWKKSFNNSLNFSYESSNGTEIQIGSSANLYILEELSLSMLKKNNIIEIYNRELPYMGNIENQNENQTYKKSLRGYQLQDCVYNSNKEKALFEQPIICFKGLIDYEEIPSINTYEVFYKQLRREKLLNMVITIPLIPIASLIVAIVVLIYSNF